MRPAPWLHLEPFRIKHPTHGGPRGEGFGAFEIPLSFAYLRVIASSGEGWDHVSVSLQNRTPTWAEMQLVREKFFLPEETVLQIHPPAHLHVNHHPYCLHLWRPHGIEIPLPPRGSVSV